MKSFEAQDVLKFWFDDVGEKGWWSKNEKLDEVIRLEFTELIQTAARGELYLWRESPEGRLAEIIVLDQFSRNAFRGTPEAFAQDPLALILSQEFVSLGLLDFLSPNQQTFALMPFMHSESKLIHAVAEKLFRDLGLEHSLDFELQHKEIIERFGRYPHRNLILGRETTAEEVEFLKTHTGF